MPLLSNDGAEMDKISFSDIAIVSCGTMSLELNFLKEDGFLDTSHIFYITPGLHQNISELERQLIRQIRKAREKLKKLLSYMAASFVM